MIRRSDVFTKCNFGQDKKNYAQARFQYTFFLSQNVLTDKIVPKILTQQNFRDTSFPHIDVFKDEIDLKHPCSQNLILNDIKQTPVNSR